MQTSPGGSDGKESACNAVDLGSILGLGSSPGEGTGNLLQYSCLEKSHAQRSLVEYSPWGHKESNMTEQLTPTGENYVNNLNNANFRQEIGTRDSLNSKETHLEDNFIGCC